MAEPIRVALAGFGAWGRMHARALAALPEAALVAVFCHGESSAAAAKAEIPHVPRHASYEAMLAAGGFDAVIVAVPNDLHAAFSVAALEAGAHVVLEKPLGLTLAECDAVIDAARRADRMVVVNHELRVSHQWGAVRGLIASGALGRVRHQHFSLFRRGFRPGSGGWRMQGDRVGSWSLEELVHFLDLLAWYGQESGEPRVAAATAQGRGATADVVTAWLEWPDGATAVVTQCLAGFEHHTLLEVACTDGAVRTWWTGREDRATQAQYELAVRRGADPPERIAIPLSGEVYELQEHLGRAFAAFRGAPATITLAEARRAVALCLEVDRMATRGV
jgi:myo-inositol 2-dehydrogenase/D-chiro-inositol 1-dehydrogenase